jgi:tyrosinase
VVAGAVIAGPSIFDFEELLAQPEWVRPDVASLGATSPIIIGYKKAIKAMRQLPASDPTSWSYQAAMHGTTVTPALTAWNTCQHWQYWFYPWHRMYLYWFERIVRSKSGMSSWALPFWDYRTTPAGSSQADAIASRRILPELFRLPADEATNPLYTTHRKTAVNDGTNWLAVTTVDPALALSQMDFTGPSVNFGGNPGSIGKLELKPHNGVHSAIGGWMGDPRTAAQDPIFWLHHANIDRYWNVWLAQGGRANPVNDATWRNKKFTFFREDGTSVEMTACDILNASAQLHYTYQGETAQVMSQCPPVIKFPPIRFTRRPIRIPIPEPRMVISEAQPVTRLMDLKGVAQAVMNEVRSAIASKDKDIILTFGVEADTQPGVIFEVWVDMEGAPDGKARQAHHVGDIVLFANGIRDRGHGAEQHTASISFRLDEAIARAVARNADKIKVTIVPRDPLEGAGIKGLKKPAAALRITDISVSVEERGK